MINQPQTFLSGQVGRAAIVYGDILKVYALDAAVTVAERPASELSLIFSGATDVVRLSLREEQVPHRLRLERLKDRALLMMLMLIDASEDDDLRSEASDILSELLTEDSAIGQFVADRLFTMPFDETADIATALELSARQEAVLAIIRSALEHQSEITAVAVRWNSIGQNTFEDEAERARIYQILADCGAFRRAAIALRANDRRAMDSLKFDLHANRAIQEFKGYREIITLWLDRLTPARVPSVKLQIADADDDAPIAKDDRFRRKLVANSVAYRRAIAQVREIQSCIQHLDFDKARRYTNQLVEFQTNNDDAAYAAKSLCNVAAYAQDIHQHSFALELTQRAVTLAPQDGWSWGQLAEAFMRLARYDEALDALSQAEVWGEQLFAATARGRLLRSQGKIDEALSQFSQVLADFRHEEDLWTAIEQLADLYRLRGEFDEALRLLEPAIERWHAEPSLRCAKAGVLAATGDLDSAYTTYDESNKYAKLSLDAYVGMGGILREKGDFAAAIRVYDEAKSRFQRFPDAFRGLAEALGESREYPRALRVCATLKKEFPFDFGGWAEAAEVLKQQQKYTSALSELNEAIKRFPNDPLPKIRRAQFYKAQGNPERALQAFSAVCADFPKSISARMGQANLFKELAYYQEALSIYDELERTSEHSPIDLAISRGAIYIALGDYEKARRCLPIVQPRTKKDWIAHHVRGMSLLKGGNFTEAIELMEAAIRAVPFPSQRPYYENALAVAKLKAKKYEEAISITAKRDDALSNVLKLHAFGGANKMKLAAAAFEKLAVDCPANVVPIRDELAAQLQLIARPPRHSSQWIFDRECDALALASTLQPLAA